MDVYLFAYVVFARRRSRRVYGAGAITGWYHPRQTLQAVEKVETYFMIQEKNYVLLVFSTVVAGPSDNGQNVARLFIRLKNWEDRTNADRLSFAIIERATKSL